MMSEGEQMRVQIGNATLTIPVYRTKGHTEAVVEALNRDLKAIEAGADRINTQAFALRLAYEYAVRADEAHQAAEAETRDMARALERILTALQGIVEASREEEIDDPPSGPGPPTNLTPFRA